MGSQPTKIRKFSPGGLKMGWIVTIVLCIVPLVFWFDQIGINSLTTSRYGLLTALGQMAGIVGLVLYSLNIIYSARLKTVEDWFGGLNRAYIAHHIIGGLALALLALHPALMVARYFGSSAKAAAEQVLPVLNMSGLDNLSSTSGQEWVVFFGSLAFFGLVVLIILTLYVKLPYGLWLLTHKFLGVFLFVAGLHVLFINSTVSNNDWLKYYLLGIVGLGLIAYIYKTLAGRIFIRRHKFKVVKVIDMAGGKVTSLILKPVKKSIYFKPGQFVFIRFTNSRAIKKEWHPFSISSAPQDELIRISAKSSGDFTATLKHAKAGHEVELEGAYGRFGYGYHKLKKQIWIAGGIGITPFLSMARALEPDQSYDIILFYCVRQKDELIDLKSLISALQTTGNKFKVIPVVSGGEKPRLKPEDVYRAASDIKERDIYLCGPITMIRPLKKELISMGIKKSNLISEEFTLT